MKITQAPLPPPAPAPFRPLCVVLETQEEYDAFYALVNNSALCDAVPVIRGWWQLCAEIGHPADSHKWHAAIENMRRASFPSPCELDQRAPGHNPDGLPVRQVESWLGWRLLDRDEIKGWHDKVRCQQWMPRKNKWSDGGLGVATDTTYRTKLSRAELQASRFP
jgi:hypothetical protein